MQRSARWLVPMLVLVVGGVVVAASLGSTRQPTVKAAFAAGYGKLVVSPNGLTLYHYTDEKRGSVECTGGCAKFWPPLLVKGNKKLVAGQGLKASKLGTVKRPGGGRQLTYNGYPLYRYAPDKKPGDVKGQGVEGEWYVIASTGKLIRKMADAGSTPATPSPPADTDPTPPPPAYPGGGYG